MIAYGIKIRQKAENLRKKGKSFGQIAKALSLGKSTVALWCKRVAINSKSKNLTPKKTLKIKFKHSKKHGVKKNKKKK